MTWPEASCVIVFTLSCFSLARAMVQNWPKRRDD
jgi:hypothetical protein